MTTTSVTDLKARLSHFLRVVKRGGEVQILERGRPVARLSPVTTGRNDDAERRQRLARSGILRPGRGDTSIVLSEEPLELPSSLLTALGDDRGDRF